MSILSKSLEWEYHFFQKCFKSDIISCFLKQVSAEKRRLIKNYRNFLEKQRIKKNVYILFYLFSVGGGDLFATGTKEIL